MKTGRQVGLDLRLNIKSSTEKRKQAVFASILMINQMANFIKRDVYIKALVFTLIIRLLLCFKLF